MRTKCVGVVSLLLLITLAPLLPWIIGRRLIEEHLTKRGENKREEH